ncbi:MAG: hypothetical protein F4X72_01745 [Dehalococcoidia bacterium]|nr:hypothetical protein [Dehalococcoidia bacterium]
MFKKILLIVAFTVLAVIGVSPVAYAEGDIPESEARALYEQVMASPDPEDAYDALGTRERLAVDRYVMPYETVTETVTEVVDIPGDAAFDSNNVSCLTNVEYERKKTWYGLTVATYKSWTFFCYDGDEVLSADFRPDGYTHFIGWSFLGHLYTNESYGPHNEYHTDYAKGDFQHCFLRQCSRWRPSITKTHWNDGHTS